VPPNLAKLFYHLEWEEAITELQGLPTQGNILIFCDRQGNDKLIRILIAEGVGTALDQLLKQKGYNTLLNYSSTSQVTSSVPNARYINLSQDDKLDGMLFPDKWKQKPGAIIYLWGLDCDSLKDVTTPQDFDKVQVH
jgi:hypothetical protein